MLKKKTGLVILFPGVRYSVDCPLLYFAGLKYVQKGYEKIGITGYGVRHPDAPQQYAEQAKERVEQELRDIRFSDYEEVVLVSKSMGTVMALWAEDHFRIKHAVHVLLTPINRTVPMLTKKRNVRFIVSGTKDKQIDLERLDQACRDNRLPLHIVEGVGHQLERPGDVSGSIEILKGLVEYF